jgi:hypothetical protein
MVPRLGSRVTTTLVGIPDVSWAKSGIPVEARQTATPKENQILDFI